MYYKISFPADFKNIAPLRDFSNHVARLLEFDQQVAERIRSVVDEICNNAIEYGSQPTSQVVLEISADEQQIKLRCHDQGHGNKLKAAEVLQKIHAGVGRESNRGRGMSMIVKGFVDDLQVIDRKDGGITVEALIKKK